MKKGTVLGFVLALVLSFSSTASAVIIVDNWTLDLSGIDGIAAGTQIEGIQQITYYGTAHYNATGLAPTTTGYVDGLLSATSFVGYFDPPLDNPDLGTIPGQIIPTGLGTEYQLTFDFSVDNLQTSFNPATGVSTFIHLDAANVLSVTDGILDIWVDGPTGGISSASSATGLGYQDGIKIASFSVMAGDGGAFNFSTMDGSDDATFTLISALPGVFLDSNGNDLSLFGDLLVGITDSNFDANPWNDGPWLLGAPGTFYPNLAASWPFAANGYGSNSSFFLEEDGSARIGVVPEPSTFMLLGAGLLGLAYCARRKKLER